MNKKSTHHRLYVFLLFVSIFATGTLYSNCGQVEEAPYRQKIFIDTVEDIYPQAICEPEQECAGVDEHSDGSYDLNKLDLAE